MQQDWSYVGKSAGPKKRLHPKRAKKSWRDQVYRRGGRQPDALEIGAVQLLEVDRKIRIGIAGGCDGIPEDGGGRQPDAPKTMQSKVLQAGIRLESGKLIHVVGAR